MQLHQIGEVLKPLDETDPDLRDRIPDVGDIIGMRNIIAHQYGSLDMDIVWIAATRRCPDLRRRILRLLDAPAPSV